jgi:transketolase
MPVDLDLQNRAINTIRFLSADAVQKANSGHPGLPMGDAALAYALWIRHLKVNPADPAWPDRDRFILSGGHGSMLLYSLLYLSGYDLPLDELKQFRQWGSRTPGHPEYGVTPGVETTTGPLGQGFANAVGMAIAETHLAAEFNRPGFQLVDHFTYAIVTDGDLMEGITSEAASLAGHLKLGKLILLYDDNRITIDGSTDLAFTEDRSARFAAYHWHVSFVQDGNDVDEVDRALEQAKQDPRPSLIICRTHIGFGLPTRQDTEKAHGEPPGLEELNGAKQKLGWPVEPSFFVPDDVLVHYRQILERGKRQEQDWEKKLKDYSAAFPSEAAEFDRRLHGRLPEKWIQGLPIYPPDARGVASRQSSWQILNAIANKLPELFGGSADLFPSNKTWIDSSQDFQAGSRSERNIHFGIREHAMGAIVNGINLHGSFISYASTFLVFSDYLRPAIRISALSAIPSIWIFTHDSIGLGEDGPTHQPVEHLAALRSIIGLCLIRPADANEMLAAWQFAITNRKKPTALILSRQNLPSIDRNQFAPAENIVKGAYVLADLGKGKLDAILMASGSEVALIIKAGQQLADEGINIRLVSFPSWDLFAAQSKEYQESVLPNDIKKRLAVEAGTSMGWQKWVGDEGTILALDQYAASAPGEVLFKQFGFTAENVVSLTRKLLDQEGKRCA